MIFSKIIKKVLNTFGYKLINKKSVLNDFEYEFREIYHYCKAFTSTSMERMYAMYQATQYISKNKIEGDIVECGVWKGGSMMVSALTLLKLNDKDRKLYLYDTYEGITPPTEKDIKIFDNTPAKEIWSKKKKDESYIEWCYAPLEEVKKNLYSTGYPKENIKLIKGRVEDTLPNIIPKNIAILRLDTDFYESTYHELIYLYPKLMKKGILIIDDYGYWAGQRKAVDRYFNENKINLLLDRIDREGRIAIKF